MNCDIRGADISECGLYRYRLWRMWTTDRPLCGWLMLNPSTADADTDDATIRKCIGFARLWGFGGIMVTNLFAFRATKPGHMKASLDPNGPDNDTFVNAEHECCERTVAAWGAHGAHLGRADEVVERLGAENLHVLRLTKAGHPGHPLYIPYETRLVTLAQALEVHRAA